MTYGLPVQRVHDPFVAKSEKCFAGLSAASSTGKYLINVLPVLKYVPGWVPGVAFKKAGAQIRELALQLIKEPYNSTLKNTVGSNPWCLDISSTELQQRDGTAPQSLVADSIERYKDRPIQEKEVKHVSLTSQRRSRRFYGP